MAKKTLALFLFYFLFLSCRGQIHVYDGFETKELSRYWTKERMVDSALQIQSGKVRSGHSGARITLEPGDVFEPGSERGIATERDELREARRFVSTEGKLYEYQFSLFLPDTFPIVPVRLVIAQWKQYCEENDTCAGENPVLAIRYSSGQLFLTIQTDSTKTTLYNTLEEVRNKWLDFKVKVRFSRLNNGQIDAWLNEKKIIHYQGITCYSSTRGYNESARVYFKTGLYRDLMSIPMTIYVDEYSKKEIEE